MSEVCRLKELKANPEEVSAHYTLGLIYYNQMRYEAALDSFLDAVGLFYYYPAAHFYIGESLNAMKEYKKALEAYDICLKLVPGMNLARQRIIYIYESRLEQPEQANQYKLSFEKKIKGTINIVSGLPRSGTSMMMQMLEAGGMNIFTDKKRVADENNPKGYYEHEAVKALKRNRSFLKDANGKTVKIIAQLLFLLPMDYRYRIVFMERHILEVVASQQKMLQRNGKRVKMDTLPLNLVKQYENTIQKVKSWAAKQANVEVLFVNYSEVLQDAYLQATLVNDFLEMDLNKQKMTAVIDVNLHREKVMTL